MFETGTNQWRKYDSWPPAAAKPRSLYFHANGRLSFDPPADGAEGYDEYVSDPAKPVPYIDKIGIGMDKEYMTADQRFAARRPDVLVYQTDVLPEDVTLAGPSYGNETGTGLLKGPLRAVQVKPSHGAYLIRLPAASAALLTLTPAATGSRPRPRTGGRH